MYRIIPFLVIFFATVAYLFYGPAPMDKISEIVKKRDCYQLKLMDQGRLSISKVKVSPTASNKIDQEFQIIPSPKVQSIVTIELAMSQKDKPLKFITNK